MLAKNQFLSFSSFSVTGAIIIFISIGFLTIYVKNVYPQVSPWKGSEVFQKKGCIQCHSVYNKGGKGGPDLGKNQFYGTYLELATLMWNHFPKMFNKMKKIGYQFPELSIKEMEQLISYLSFMRYRGEPGRESLGKKLLKSKGCYSCHKFGGEGGDIGTDMSNNDCVSPLMLAESMWNHGPNMMELFEKNNIKRPEFKGNEMIHIATAIRAFTPSTSRVPVGSYDLGNPTIGEKLFEKKGCLHCHKIRGIGGDLGPDLNEIDLDYSVTQIAGKMWNHGPKMWSLMKDEGVTFPHFEKGEMANIIAYLYALKLKDAPGNKEEGYKFLQNGPCLTCHSLQGKGASVSFDLETLGEMESPLAMVTAMWNHAPAILAKHIEKKQRWPKLKNKDIANIYSYLHSIAGDTLSSIK